MSEATESPDNRSPGAQAGKLSWGSRSTRCDQPAALRLRHLRLAVDLAAAVQPLLRVQDHRSVAAGPHGEVPGQHLDPLHPAHAAELGPPFLNDLFWQPTVILQRPDHNGSYTTFPDEAWFFVNGIMTNDSVAQVNSAYLAYLFHRPLTMIQNSTDSLWADLFDARWARSGIGSSSRRSRRSRPSTKR